MKELEVQKGGTLPKFEEPKRLRKYPFLEMKVGDFFFIYKENTTKRFRQYILDRSRRWKKTFKIEVCADEDGKPGYRVWRTA